MNNKAIIEFGFRNMKNSADLGGCYPPLPSAYVENKLLLRNSSYPTQPHSIIAKYLDATLTSLILIQKCAGLVVGALRVWIE